MNVNTSKIIVRRHEYEEPYHTQLEFIISNGMFSTAVDLYCNVEDIKDIGEALCAFPQKVHDEYSYTYGSENPEDKFYRLFRLRAYTINAAGHCALQFKINLNEAEPSEGQSLFSIPAEAAAINQLGELFVKFSQLKHKELQWTEKKSQLFENHQNEYESGLI